MNQRKSMTERRVQAALATLLALWMPPDEAQAADAHRARRRFLRSVWPGLVAALDEVVLAVTADTAAQIEALQNHQATVTQLCPGSGALISENEVVYQLYDKKHVAKCGSCAQYIPAARHHSSPRVWQLASHTTGGTA